MYSLQTKHMQPWYIAKQVKQRSLCDYSFGECITRQLRTLQASTTEFDVNRHGRVANLVATIALSWVPVDLMNSPKNSSDFPNPYISAATGIKQVLHSL